MAIVDLTSETLDLFIQRVNALNADTSGKWGKMNSAQMLTHLRLSTEGGLGEIPVKDRSNFIMRMMGPIVMSGRIPMPKKAKTAPEYVGDAGENFDEEKAAFIDAMGRFVKRCEEEPDKPMLHPLFGPMTVAQWQRGHGVHFAHHLKQFGV